MKLLAILFITILYSPHPQESPELLLGVPVKEKGVIVYKFTYAGTVGE